MNVRIVCVHFLSFCRNLNGNNFACDCNVYNSIVAVITALTASRAATCATPSRVAVVEFYPGGSYEKQPVQDFTCCTYFIKFLDSPYCPLAIRLNSRNYVSKYTIGSVAPLTIISSFSSTSEYFCNSPGRFPAESGLVTTLLPLSASHSGCKHYLCGYVEYYDCKCPLFYLDCRYN